MKEFLIADTHLGHKKLVTLGLRPPFQSVGEMNTSMIHLWNETVAKEDLVIHLGDVSMGMNYKLVAEIIKNLNGRKVLIPGNHDHDKSIHWWMTEGGFDFASDKLLYKGVWLTHYPAKELPSGAYINIHGHLHNLSPADPVVWKGIHQGGLLPFHYLLAPEIHGYAPVEWDKFVPKEGTTWRSAVNRNEPQTAN